MTNQTDVKLSPTPPTSNIRPKLEQIQRQSTRRKRPTPKVEESEEAIEDFLVVDDSHLVLSSIKQDNENNKEQQEDDGGLVEFSRGYTNKSALCIWHNGMFLEYFLL